MLTIRSFLIHFSVILIFTAAAFGQNKYEGYSFTVEADNSGACPIRYITSAGSANAIDVLVAGTNQTTRATDITACDGSTLSSGSNVVTNGYSRWCFQGPEPMYDIRLTTGISYLWYPISKDTGFYNVKDFRPVTRTAGATPEYAFTEPADYTKTIKNAVAYVATRQGGTLRFPDGDYIVGTTDGNSRDPNYQAITLPSGINIVGAGSNFSVANSDLPFRFNPTRIRLRNPNQTIFRIGGCTNRVTVRDIELLGNSELLGEPKRDTKGDYGIEGMGKWARDASTGAESSNTSQMFRFENVTFQNLDIGIYVHNANDQNCNPKEQLCTSWQFDYVKVDHSLFLNNRTGIWINTFNTDWNITNSVFNYNSANPPGDGIHVQRAGSMLIEQSWGGGYDYGTAIGGTFIYIDTIGSLTIINSGSERGRRSIYTSPMGSISSLMLTVIGSVFGDKIELHGRLNLNSSGNLYFGNTMQTDPTVAITSLGDRFCYDPNVFPGHCTDEMQKNVRDPGFGKARAMFQTGRLPDGKGADLIERRPNFFGYDVEISNGLLQFDNNVTFKDITMWAANTEGGARVKDGALAYCKDCRKDSSGTCTQGTAGTDGAFAKRINGKWRCD